MRPPVSLIELFGLGDEAGSTLEKAWTQEDADAFEAIIVGEDDWAKVNGVLQNGENDTLKVASYTTSAVQLARNEYPLVYKAFRIKKDSK